MFPDNAQRLKIDLAGSWRYTRDGKEWGTIGVPSAYDFTGRVTFLRNFEITSGMVDNYCFSLVVYGINYQSEISINGNFIGRHMGGYSSFVLTIPDNTLQVGVENAISISVDNELTPKTTIPLRQQVGGWRTYGGIFRDIYILAHPRLAIESAAVRAVLAEEAKNVKMNIQAEILDRGSGFTAGSGTSFAFQTEVYDKLTGELVGRSGLAAFAPQPNKSVSIAADVTVATPKLWTPETPDLYILKCQVVRIVNKEVIVIDEYDLDCGVRDIRWKEGRMFLNGNLTPLRGVLWNEDHATFSSAMTYEALEKDVALIKTLGANLVRFRYPPHPYVLNLCDRYGLFVLEEIPLVDVPEEILARDYYQDLAATYAREMVLRDKHHASVLAWGVGDEFQGSSSEMCDHVNTLRNIVKSLDARPVYYASQNGDDPCFEYVDIVAINARGTDAKDFRERLKVWKGKRRDTPVIVVRYGQPVEPDNRNGYSDPLSMESQARHAMVMFDAMKESKIAGSILWSFNDWRTDRPALTARSNDPYLQTMGIVSYDREKRIAFHVVRALFNGEKVQALPIGNYSSSTPIIYVVAGLLALISFAFLYNANRRFRDCVNRSLFRTYNFFADVRDQRILSSAHSVFLAAIVSLTIATMLSSVFTHFRGSVVLDNMLSQFLDDGLKEWFVRLVWNPPNFILVISALLFLKLLLLTALVRLGSMAVRTRVQFYHAFSVTMWSMLPYITFIPIAMILYRLLDVEYYIVPLFIAIVIVTLWVLHRLLKGISIIYDVVPVKVYSVGILVIIIGAAALYGYFDYTRSTSVYLKYMFHTVQSLL